MRDYADPRRRSSTPPPAKPPALTPAAPLRWWEFVPRRAVRCPCGHHIKNTFRIPENSFVRCQEWDDANHRECGRWVWIYTFRGGHCLVVEVDREEQDEMEDLATPAQMLAHLGIFERLERSA